MTLPVFVSETLHHEAIDWATRASANGGVISTATIRAVSAFCRAIDAAGIRGKLWRFSPFAGGNLSGCLVPLYRGPAHGGTTYGNATDVNSNFVSADYVDSGATGGLKGNGTNKSLNTGFLANTNAASNTHIAVGIVTATTLTSYRCPIGVYNGSSHALNIDERRGGGGARSCTFTRVATATDQFGDSVIAATLVPGNIVAAWPTMYRNGSASGTDATTSESYPSAHSLSVFALTNVSTPINFTDARLGWYSIGETMTAAQVVEYHNALVALRAALGR